MPNNMPTTVRDTQALLDPARREVPHASAARRTPRGSTRDGLAAYHDVGRALLEQAARTGRKEAALAAAEVFRSALQQDPLDPPLRNALGASLVEIARLEPVAAAINTLTAAAAEFEAAGTEARRRSAPAATTLRYRVNLAMGLWMLGERAEDTGHVDQSIGILTSIAAQLAPTSALWPHVQDNLGNALMAMGRATEAVAAYQAGLEGRCSVTERARSLGNLGTAHLVLGHSTQAHERFSEALGLIRRERSPLAWGRMQHNLGCALFQAALARQSKNAADNLTAAVAAFETALEERQRSRLPLDWAITTANLAAALVALGTHLCTRRPMPDPHAGLATIRRAVQLYRDAMPDLPAGDREKAERNAAVAREILDRLSGGEARLPPLPPGLAWPNETYAEAHRARREGIVQFLDRVWQPLILAGVVNLRTLRLRDPSAAKGIDNFKRRIDPNTGQPGRLPLHLDIPTRKQQNDRLAQAIAEPGDRPARLDWALRARRRRVKEKV